MNGLLKNISNHPLVPLGGILLGVIGIALAVIFYIRSRRVSKVRYEFISRSLVEGLSGALEGIEVTYKGETQERITVSRFVFWNAGTETIRSDDFTDDQLRIAFPQNISILDYRIIEANDKTNKIEIGPVVSAEKEEKSFNIRFDYLDSDDGAIVQIVHDGEDGTKFSLKGSLKGNCSIAKTESPAYGFERRHAHDTLTRILPRSSILMKASWFGWVGGFVYFCIGVFGLLAPFFGFSWWFLALAFFGFFASSVMIFTFTTGQVPTHFRRELGKLPTANKSVEVME